MNKRRAMSRLLSPAPRRLPAPPQVPAAAMVARGLLTCAMALYATASHAGNGFLLRSQSATTLGTAQAGMATLTDDVSGMVFNPALLGYVKSQELTFGFTP